ncbi:ATP-binding cassette domain-containing protein [Pseudooceanicola sp. CBS1P-1]|uniref:ABC transporter ATP-binding protein n=1 Tax=Pseudooceanicola TaxID=1679449 RepID=UPI0019290B93|nr:MULTISPECIES: ABC transporter ATP-binding protein [Pseudooceanicola]MBT9385431.1 ATP-binding cassette domain-containing protein [Pseudooceanicola endophyticus]
MSHPAPILTVSDLRIETTGPQPAALLESVSFDIRPGETLALVGESGAGKSLSALAILGLLPPDAMRVAAGQIHLGRTDLATLSARQMRAVRGGRVAMIFQDPLGCLNPVLTVGRQITEALRLHKGLRGAAARARAVELLELVRIPEPRKRLDEYPHRLSGGMRQRVMIAIALAGEPELLLADEPTTALDVTISTQIITLLRQLQADIGLSILMITHDLPAVRMIADRVAVMYSGRIVETGIADAVFAAPRHPYTQGLLSARPRGAIAAGAAPLTEIPGAVPQPNERPSGCTFRPRCPRASALCAQERPAMPPATSGSKAACHHAGTSTDHARAF